MLGLILLAWLGAAGCTIFGLPDFPVELRHPPRVAPRRNAPTLFRTIAEALAPGEETG